MRRWFIGIGAVVVLGVALWAWPLTGAAQLASAARSGNVDQIYDHVDIDELRRSLSRQIATAYLDASGKTSKLGAFGRSVANSAVTTVADPYVAQLLTPENIAALLSQGRINQVKLGDRSVSVKGGLPKFSSMLDQNLLASVTGSYYAQPRDFVIPVDGGQGADDRYGVHMHLTGLTWKLGGLDLPPAMVADMAKSLLASNEKPQAL